MLNGAGALLIGIFLLSVAWNNNQGKLFSLISTEGGFFKWIAALLSLAYLYRISGGQFSQVVQQISAAAIAALFIGKGEEIFKEVDRVIKGDNSK